MSTPNEAVKSDSENPAAPEKEDISGVDIQKTKVASTEDKPSGKRDFEEDLVDAFLTGDAEEARSAVERVSKNFGKKKSPKKEKPKNKSKYESEEFENLHASRKGFSPPKTKRGARNYSQELYEEGNKNPPPKAGKSKGWFKKSETIRTVGTLDTVSLPSEIGNDPVERAKAREAKSREEQRRKDNKAFLGGNKRRKKKKKGSRELTMVLGTKRYNPFAFGGSTFSSFGTLGNTLRGKKTRQALQKDNPFMVKLVKGFYLPKRKNDMDNESVASSVNAAAGGGFFAGLRRFKKKGQRESTLSQREINHLNNTLRKSNMEGLTRSEIQMIEGDMERRGGRGAIQKVGCFGFISSCFDSIKKSRAKEGQQQGRQSPVSDGMNDLEELTFVEPKNQDRAQKRKSPRKESVNRPECAISKFKLSKYDQTSTFKDPATGEVFTFHMDCVKCELTRKVVGYERAVEMRKNKQPVLTDEAMNHIEEAKEAQNKIHSQPNYSKPNEYHILSPEGYAKFVPINVVVGGVHTKGILSLCSKCGVSFNSKDKNVVSKGLERIHVACPTGLKLRSRLSRDMKMIALGLPTKIRLRMNASSGILNNPLTMDFVFSQDKDTLQYDIVSSRNQIAVVYGLSREQEQICFTTNNIKVGSLIFSGELLEDVAAFTEGMTIVRQEQDMRTTGDYLFMNGRFKHGLVYEWLCKMHFNEKDQTLTPQALELTMKVLV